MTPEFQVQREFDIINLGQGGLDVRYSDSAVRPYTRYVLIHGVTVTRFIFGQVRLNVRYSDCSGSGFKEFTE